tara:strand:- start:1552 stop:2880 length:1329 start_codon:yes stop_codon:yes gene_type:complete
MIIRYINDYGDGTSGYLDSGSGIVVTTASGQPIEVTTTSSGVVQVQPGGTGSDAFGRLRVSNPLTLFDSSHRYRDNGLWTTSTGTGGTTSFDANAGLVTLNTTTASGSFILRETTKCFAYQPGKSLLVMSTFVMNAAQTNLRQRVGYYGASNGIFLEQDGTTISLVERSAVTGSTVDTKVAKASWNVDPMDGTGPSGYTLDLTKAQIFWMDIEWLGVGTVRVGFVVNGEFIHCHSFHHANLVTSTYITTASLPLRYEITNTGTTASSSTMKQICSTVLSEGGYELRGLQQAIGTTITAPHSLTTAGTSYPIVSLRLKAANLDAIVILTAISVLGITSANYLWRVVATATTTGGTWVSAGTSSSVEYNLTGTATTGGRILAQGYFSSTNQNTTQIDILKEALFSFQLERDDLTSTPYELSLILTASANTSTVHASMDWEEISR